MRNNETLAVLSDAVETATGEAVDLTQWDLQQLLRVLRNPTAVLQMTSAKRIVCCRRPGEGRPDASACRQRLSLIRLLGERVVSQLVREERERQLRDADTQPIWRAQLEAQWSRDSESFDRWCVENGVNP